MMMIFFRHLLRGKASFKLKNAAGKKVIRPFTNLLWDRNRSFNCEGQLLMKNKIRRCLQYIAVLFHYFTSTSKTFYYIVRCRAHESDPMDTDPMGSQQAILVESFKHREQ